MSGTEVCLVKMQTPGPAASLLNQVLQGWASAFYTVSRVPGLPPVGTPELERPGGPPPSSAEGPAARSSPLTRDVF